MSALLAIAGLLWLAQPAVTITTANNTPRELRARQLVEDVLSTYVHEQIHWHLRERGDDQRQGLP